MRTPLFDKARWKLEASLNSGLDDRFQYYSIASNITVSCE